MGGFPLQKESTCSEFTHFWEHESHIEADTTATEALHDLQILFPGELPSAICWISHQQWLIYNSFTYPSINRAECWIIQVRLRLLCRQSSKFLNKCVRVCVHATPARAESNERRRGRGSVGVAGRVNQSAEGRNQQWILNSNNQCGRRWSWHHLPFHTYSSVYACLMRSWRCSCIYRSIMMHPVTSKHMLFYIHGRR